MTKGIDDHLADGKSISEYKDIDKSKELKEEVKSEKRRLHLIIRDKVLSQVKMRSVDESFYILTRNVLNGGYWKKVDDRQVSIAIERASGKNYTRTLSSEVINVLHNATYRRRDEIQTDPFEINVLNGVLNVQTGAIRNFNEVDMFTYQIPIQYDPNARCSQWEQVLKQIFQDAPENIPLLQTICGYCLQSAHNSERFFVFYGNGANGKGVVTHVLERIIGIENTTSLGLEKLGNPRWSETLIDKMLNLATESDSKASKWSETMKTAVSGEALMVDPKYKSPFKFYPTAKHIITMNERPYIEDKSDGIIRRMVIVPFDRHFKEDERDIGLKRRLIELEGQGILNWFIQGFKNYISEGFVIPERNQEILREIKIESNSVMLFVEECCDLAFMDDEIHTPTDEFYSAYKHWCNESGHKAFSKTKVSRCLNNDYDIKNKVIRFGIGFKRSYMHIKIGQIS